jgi:hypothetical protein
MTRRRSALVVLAGLFSLAAACQGPNEVRTRIPFAYASGLGTGAGSNPQSDVLQLQHGEELREVRRALDCVLRERDLSVLEEDPGPPVSLRTDTAPIDTEVVIAQNPALDPAHRYGLSVELRFEIVERDIELVFQNRLTERGAGGDRWFDVDPTRYRGAPLAEMLREELAEALRRRSEEGRC